MPCLQPRAIAIPAAVKRAAGGRAKVGGRPVSEQGVLRNLHKRKSQRRGEDYDGAQPKP